MTVVGRPLQTRQVAEFSREVPVGYKWALYL
ncbi:protein of unknown function (plasmid) [Pararobbsia alpina]